MSRHAHNVRKAVLVSMSLTTRHWGYTHDDYDAAHESLNALLAALDYQRNRNEVLEGLLGSSYSALGRLISGDQGDALRFWELRTEIRSALRSVADERENDA